MANTEVKILTLNTWKGDGDYFQRLNVMADQLKNVEADVIVCQECFVIPDSSVNTLEFLAQKLNMYSAFTAARSKKREFNNSTVDSLSGLGVISSCPMSIVQEVSLPTREEDGERKIQITEIELTKEKRLAIVNVHLTHLQNATDLRNQQVHVIANALSTIKGYAAILICGDFNAEINSPEINLITTLLQAGDVYALGGGKYPRQGRYERNNFQIAKSVDHIFSLPDASGKLPHFSNSRQVLDFPDSVTGLFASDHPALITTLRINI
jgi:endonuclease/exonuclease/phosphatase family metal-dependent hydrolase